LTRTPTSGDLLAAAKRGDLHAVRALLDAGADVNEYGGRRGSRGTALTWAAKRNRSAIVRELLVRGADVALRDEEGKTALMWAAEVCPAKTVGELITRCQELATDRISLTSLINAVDPRGESALLIAASEGRADVVLALLAAGADCAHGHAGDSTSSAFRRLAGSTKRSATQVTALHALLNAGADVNAVDPYGFTALIRLCVASNASLRGPHADGIVVTRLLIDAGANVNAQDDGGYTALMFAARAGEIAQMRLLLDHGADPNLAAPRPNGTTALLESACSWCGIEPMRLLLDAGAEVNVQDNVGRTALMSAAISAEIAQVRLLLSRGADPTLRSMWGRTARESSRAEAAVRPKAEAAGVDALLREAEDAWIDSRTGN